jgi:glutaredoxin
MALIRWIVGKLILFFDGTFPPASPIKSPEEETRLANSVKGMEIYQYAACPFCVKVRRFLTREGISLPLRDAKSEPYRSELLKGGGKLQVPCLKITDSEGQVSWMYESGDIIDFLGAKTRA